MKLLQRMATCRLMPLGSELYGYAEAGEQVAKAEEEAEDREYAKLKAKE